MSAGGHAFELRPHECPICGIGAAKVLGYRGGRYHRYGAGIETRIVQCRCGLIYPDPFPFPRDVQQLYGDPEKYFEGHDECWKLEAYRKLIREVKGRLGRSDRISLLDVGSGRGELLRAAALEGVEATGLELSEAMAAYAQRSGLQVYTRSVEDFAAATESRFDAVVLAGVIEHVHNPDAMIASVKQVTRIGSLLYIDTPMEPNLRTVLGNSYNRLRRSRAVYNLSPTWRPYHVYGFNRKVMRLLLNKYDFDVVEILVRGWPKVPARGGLVDRAMALVATQINRLANLTGTAGNMYIWARRR